MTAPAGKTWYVVMTHPHSEAMAAEHLRRQGFETYLPRIRKQRRHARKTEIVSSPLFPRYLFVAIDQTCQRWRSIRSTRGVTHLVGTDDGPTQMPGNILAELRGRENEQGFIPLEQAPPFARGERVRIMEGVFSPCSAFFEFMSDDDRAAVLLEFLGRPVRVLVARTTLAAA